MPEPMHLKIGSRPNLGSPITPEAQAPDYRVSKTNNQDIKINFNLENIETKK